MQTNRWLLLLVVALIVLAGLNLYASMRGGHVASGGGNDSPNRDAVLVEKVKDEAERARMKKYLDELQAPQKVSKSIVAPSGETIDCVDISTQPALNRPEMRGHEIKLAPSSLLSEAVEGLAAARAPAEIPSQLYLLTGESCPQRTVPIRRLTMETLTRFATLEDFFNKRGGRIEAPCGGEAAAPGHEYAHAARSVDNWGAEALFNVWSDYVERADEFALSQMWVTRGAGADLETVEAGWQLYPDLYGDWRAHLFIYFTPDNYGSGGCYNLTCGAFVQVDSSVYIGGGFTNYSSVAGTQYEFKLMLLKDHATGDWWLRYGDTWVGYWPRSLFDSNGLQSQAANIDFGGEIVNRQTDGRHTRTDMGSGHWPYEGFGYATYQRNLRYIDLTYTYQTASGLSESRSNADCYDIDLTDSSGSWGSYFYFGGSGLNSQCP